jgi:hypothetical protein
MMVHSFTLTVLVGFMWSQTICEGRLFDHQIKNQFGGEMDYDGIDEEFHDTRSPREPLRMYNRFSTKSTVSDEDSESTKSSDLVATITYLLKPIDFTFRALWSTIGHIFCGLEALSMSFIDGNLSGIKGSRRSSTVLITWIVMATISLVFSLAIKRIFTSLRIRNRPSSKKIVTFIKELTLIESLARKGHVRIYPGIPKSMVARPAVPGDEASLIASRWINFILSSVMSPSHNGKLIAVCLQRWLNAINHFLQLRFREVTIFCHG